MDSYLVSDFVKTAYDEIKARKPYDRSEEDRRYAIVLTELEKVIAYVDYYIDKDANCSK